MNNETTPMTPIRILLVDDHALFRSGLRLPLQSVAGFEIAGEAADGLEAVKQAHALKPDLVLLDLNMPNLSGVDALRLIKQDAPELTVLMLTVSEDGEDLTDALRAGASGYLIKNIEADTLIEGIRKAAEGESVVSPAMMGKLVAGLRSNPPPAEDATARLTGREREVAAALARGESNKEIARTLALAESTVKIHVQNILKKLHLASRVQVAVYVVEHGLQGPAGQE